ncbi:hypothetical protein [Candidatus Nitrosocosmicus arcticus]|uniref:Uncharacterized protein n=1 Tax=Candidatus Nitrosocosmicus arcticus TaxID=2035267 RepID=A0A557SX54_9ARCH|nr:hypothetical protein [Candidatus Nitrosocosmicus arcticus]TVP41189.1 hypothetical protein NARC_40152 [Candidatus Nitrosocosmicus arcticus]
MRIKAFCSLTMVPTLILVLLLLSSLDNYLVPTNSYGQPLGDSGLNQTNTDSVSSSDSVANSTAACDITGIE